MKQYPSRELNYTTIVPISELNIFNINIVLQFLYNFQNTSSTEQL